MCLNDVVLFLGHCKSPNKQCSHKCHDIQDLGYICYCRDGYKLNSDGFSCSGTQHLTPVIALHMVGILKSENSNSF